MGPRATNTAIGNWSPRRLGLLVGVVFGVVVLDQFTKWLVMSTMRLHESIPIIPDLFSLTYIRNTGAAFGILAGSHSGFRLVFFAVTSVLALALLGTIYVRLSPVDWLGQVSVAAIFGGAVGNLIDRVRFGAVIDFLDFYTIGPNIDFYIGRYHLVYVGPYHWPAFNVADAAITVGVCFLIGHFLLHKAEAPA